MELLIALLVVSIIGALAYAWVKLVKAVCDPIINRLEKKKRRLEKSDNPYVQAHLKRRTNDEMYDEYLNWLDKTGGSLPIDKIKTKEEQRFEQEINKSNSFRRRKGK